MLLILVTGFPIYKNFVISGITGIKKSANRKKTRPINTEVSVDKETSADAEDLIVSCYIY